MQAHEKTDAANKDKVLIITDSCEFGEEVSSILSNGDIAPLIADTQELYTAMLAKHPLVAIIDEDMEPGGWKISEDIREKSEVPIIIIGESDAELAWMRAAEGKIDFFLTQPFGPQELMARIKSLTRRAKRSDPAEALLR